jgi:hypothetical protein
LNVTVPHPTLQRTDVDAIAQMLSREGVAKFVQEEALTMRTLGALSDPFNSIFPSALVACPRNILNK